MSLNDLLSQLANNLDDFQNVIDHEKEKFESKFNTLIEKIVICEGTIRTYTQKVVINEDIDIDQEDLQLELEDVNQKLKVEEIKNKELEQDINELNALIDLYVKEAGKREHLEEEYREKVTEKLKLKIKRLEEEMFSKIGEIHNLENTVIELRSELSKKDEEIGDLNEKLTLCCKI